MGGSPENDVPLTGGHASAVAMVGDTVRRSTGPWTPAVYALLRHLESVGFAGAPRVLGKDERGREPLSLVPGVVPDRASPEVVNGRWPRSAACSVATTRPSRGSCFRPGSPGTTLRSPARERWSATTTSP